MSDTTSVRITVRKRDYETIKEEFDNIVDYDDMWDSGENKTLITVRSDQRQSGNWDELEGLLEEFNIEYDQEWDAGVAYDAGKVHHRLDENNNLKQLELSAAEQEVLRRLHRYRDLLSANDIEGLKDAINNEYESLKPFEVLPLDTENSLRFIKDGHEN